MFEFASELQISLRHERCPFRHLREAKTWFCHSKCRLQWLDSSFSEWMHYARKLDKFQLLCGVWSATYKVGRWCHLWLAKGREAQSGQSLLRRCVPLWGLGLALRRLTWFVRSPKFALCCRDCLLQAGLNASQDRRKWCPFSELQFFPAASCLCSKTCHCLLLLDLDRKIWLSFCSRSSFVFFFVFQICCAVNCPLEAYCSRKLRPCEL